KGRRQSMRRLTNLTGAAAIAGAVVAAACAPASAASEQVLLYDFGDETKTLTASQYADHLQPTEMTARHPDSLSWGDYNDLLAPVTDGVVWSKGWYEEPADANALQFEVAVDAGWEVTLDSWSAIMWLTASARRFEM